MNKEVANDILQKSINRLIDRNQKNNKYGFINPSEISADIIVNGALAIIENRNQRISENYINDDVEGIDPREILMKNLKIWTSLKDNIKADEEYMFIADCFKLASLEIVDGLTLDDANYVKKEIIQLASNGNVEEVLSNYFLARHGFDPLNS